MNDALSTRLYSLLTWRTVESASRVTQLILVAALLLGLALIRVHQRHEVRRLAYEVARLQERIAVEGERGRRLQLEKATLADPGRVRKMASELGMTPIRSEHVRKAQVP